MKHKISILFNKSRIVLATLILFVFGLLVGVFFSFPEMKIKQKIISSIETQGHVFINQGDINIGFLNINGSNLLIQPKNTLWPAFSIDSFNISPQWLTLLSTNPGVHLETQLFSGTLSADMSRDGAINVIASQLNLDFLSQKEQEITVSGQLEKMTLASIAPLQKTTDSLLALTLKNVNVTKNGDLKLALNLGDIVVNVTGRGRSFKIISLKTDRGDFSASGTGSVLIGRDLSSTRFNVKMDIRPEASADPMVVELLKLGTHQTPSGNYELRFSGLLSDL